MACQRRMANRAYSNEKGLAERERHINAYGTFVYQCWFDNVPLPTAAMQNADPSYTPTEFFCLFRHSKAIPNANANISNFIFEINATFFSSLEFFGETVGSVPSPIMQSWWELNEWYFLCRTRYRTIKKQKQMMHIKAILIRADTINSLGSGSMLTVVVAVCLLLYVMNAVVCFFFSSFARYTHTTIKHR